MEDFEQECEYCAEGGKMVEGTNNCDNCGMNCCDSCFIGGEYCVHCEEGGFAEEHRKENENN